MSLFEGRPELLRAFRDAQRDALEVVYRGYVRAVDRYLRTQIRASGYRDLAQAGTVADLIQDVFVRAFSRSGRLGYDGVRPYAPYLTTIARNCFIDALRARGREVSMSPDDLTLILDDTNPLPDEWCEPRTQAVVVEYVGALSPPLAGIYQQRFVLGRSQEQASAALGLSRRSVRTAENHLRRGLRQALARAGISWRELCDELADSPARIAGPSVRMGTEL
jgi:RNA polymerase sigma factor (sigma-70 family)